MISVIICTHNPRPDFFQRVINALKNQTLETSQWEIIIVDNASTEPLEGNWDISWHPHARCVRELAIGLTPARLRGICEANGEILLFVDDDCELHLEYLENVLAIDKLHPSLGTWGGQCHPEFEVTPEDWMKEFWGHWTIRIFNKEQWSNDYDRDSSMPWGAGICVRSQVAKEYLVKTKGDAFLCSLGRTADRLLSCEDLFMVICGQSLNLGFGIFPQLKLNHLIPKNRITEKYLLRAVEGHAYSWLLLKSRLGEDVLIMPIGKIRRKLGKWRRKLTMPRRERLFFEARLAGQQEAAVVVNSLKNTNSEL